MSENNSAVDQARFELEQKKLEFEQDKYNRDNSFFNKNFGVIITAIISVATVIVSASQIYISRLNNNAQLVSEQKKSDRSFSFELAKFMLEKGNDINTSDVTRARYIRTAVVAFFPSDYRAQIAKRMRDLTTEPELKSEWADALEYVQGGVVPEATTEKTDTITAEKLDAAFPKLVGADKKIQLLALLDAAKNAQVTDRNDLSIFLAAVFYNTDFLGSQVEDLNYRADRILMLWPLRFKTIENAQKFEGNPVALANLIYANRFGNREQGDGFKYRGRGNFQVTGRDNYISVGKAIGVDLEADPDRILDPTINAKSALYLFSRQTASVRKDGKLDFVAANQSLNGSILGLGSMRVTYDRLLKL